jgi:hypothetical protein
VRQLRQDLVRYIELSDRPVKVDKDNRGGGHARFCRHLIDQHKPTSRFQMANGKEQMANVKQFEFCSRFAGPFAI